MADKKQNKQNKPQTAAGQGQGVPLSGKQQVEARKLENQIQQIEQQLQGASNDELKAISTKLDSVERAMLLEKIDNQLHTMKDAMVKPGDGASPAAAGAAAAGAATINQAAAE